MFLDGSHDGDKTRERMRKGQENEGKNNKKKLVTHEISRSSGGSWVQTKSGATVKTTKPFCSFINRSRHTGKVLEGLLVFNREQHDRRRRNRNDHDE